MRQIKVSKNLYRGEPITGPIRIYGLAHARKAVYHKNWKVVPCAFLINMQFWMIAKSVKSGHFYEVYKITEEKNE